MSYLREALERKDKELTRVIKAATPLHKTKKSKTLYVYKKKGTENYYYYLHSLDPAAGIRNKTYLSCKKTDVIQQYAQHEYANRIYASAYHLREQIRSLLNNYSENDLLDIFNSMTPGKRKFLEPYVISDEQFAAEWQLQSYIPNSYPFSDSNFFTMKKERVRSKSEMIIADRLNQYGVPYHYEMPLQLSNGFTCYPDFTVLNVRTREVFYWEHLGMMNNEEYLDKSLQKLDLYSESGIIMGKNLLLTYETSQRPLDMNSVIRNIETFLL